MYFKIELCDKFLSLVTGNSQESRFQSRIARFQGKTTIHKKDIHKLAGSVSCTGYQGYQLSTTSLPFNPRLTKPFFVTRLTNGGVVTKFLSSK